LATAIATFTCYGSNDKVNKKEVTDKVPVILNKPVYRDTLQNAFRLTQENIKSDIAANDPADTSDKELHKAYYTAGTYKELKTLNIVQKKGGLFGIGGAETIKPDLKKTNFTEVDTRQATGIVISGKKAKLITRHPVGSYELKKEGDEITYLTIKDPGKFWSNSEYLVIEVK